MTPILDILPPAKTLVNELNPWRRTPCQLLVAVREVLVEAGWYGGWYCMWGPREVLNEFGDHLLAYYTDARFSWREINRLTPANHDEMIAAAELAVNLTVRAQHRCFEEEIRA